VTCFMLCIYSNAGFFWRTTDINSWELCRVSLSEKHTPTDVGLLVEMDRANSATRPVAGMGKVAFLQFVAISGSHGARLSR
jgi:hypothetical protein